MFQNEVQSVQWSKKEVSLLTAAIWSYAKLHPTVLLSDNLDHSKETIIPYMDIIFQMLPDSVQTVSVWSDGPSSQFKNRFMVAVVPLLERKLKKGIVWNYFAALHGKGPVDETGSALKRTVWNNERQRKAIVTNTDSFVNAASESNICILNVSTIDLQNRVSG